MKYTDLPGMFRFVRDGVTGQFRCAFEVDVFPVEHPAVAYRREHCATCDKAVRDDNRQPKACGECGCPLACALRIPEKGCPLDRFPALTLNGDTLRR